MQMNDRERRPSCRSGHLTDSTAAPRTLRRLPLPIAALLAALSLAGCSSSPLIPSSADTTPLVLVPIAQAGVVDARARFREIFCEVLEQGKASLPDYRRCDEALRRVGAEEEGTGRAVTLGPSRHRLVAVVVPGIGWDCFSNWLSPKGSVAEHLRQIGFDQVTLQVDGLSSSANNARQIRDAIMQMDQPGDAPRIVLIGYSKGAPDILEAVTAYPEIRSRVAAVVSAAGAIGGSALANDASQSQLDLLRHWPGSECTAGDAGGLDSLRPEPRKAWLATHPLPEGLHYYSLVTFPEPERISAVLKPSYNKLGQIDGRNDSQVIFYDQIIPGSTLVGYINADHWALAVPIGRSHPTLRKTFVNHNDYPREALLEAMLRLIEEDLDTQTR